MGDLLRYEERPEWFTPGSPWDQDPSDELDDAWDELLHGKHHISKLLMNEAR